MRGVAPESSAAAVAELEAAGVEVARSVPGRAADRLSRVERSSVWKLIAVAIEKPDDMNVIIGQAHFIKTVEDLHEALVGVSPRLRFGIAFCEASSPCLIRHSGNDDALVELATR